MLRKFFLNRKSKPRNFYILLAVAMPVAIAAAVSAWAASDLRTALYMGIVQILLSVVILNVAWNLSRLEKNQIHHAPQRTPFRIGLVISFNIFLLLALVYGIVTLAIDLAHDRPLYLILMDVWPIIISGGLFFFTPLDDYFLSIRSLWRF